MPSMPKHIPFFIIASPASYYAELDIEGKSKKLQNLAKIDFPVIENGKFIEEKLGEALEKLNQKTLYFVISDEVFLHHIGEFPLKSPSPLEEQISSTVATAFPDQQESLHIVTLSLAKTSKTQTIQITAMTRENLHVLSRVCKAVGISAKLLMPASFAVKGFVSIDPSLFILQSADDVWLTSHYIGVEHAEALGNTDVDKLVHAVTQLKNQKPHLQHAYLAVEADKSESYTNALKDVLPTQDVEIKGIEAEKDCPLMIKILTVGTRDVVDNKFPFPQFSLEENPDKAPTTVAPIEKSNKAEATEDTPAVTAIPEVPKPSVSSATVSAPKTTDSSTNEDVKESASEEVAPAMGGIVAPKTVTPPITTSTTPSKTTPVVTSPADTKPGTPTPVTTPGVAPVTSVKPKRSFGKYLLLAVGVALIIALIGGGIIVSQGAITGGNQPTPEPTTTPVATEAPVEVTPTPEASTSAIPKDEVQVLVLNATGVAGKAGNTARVFETAGYENVDTGNAKGDYEDSGTFVMVKDEANAGIIEEMTEDTKLELEKMDYDKAEDVAGKYDVIIILNE